MSIAIGKNEYRINDLQVIAYGVSHTNEEMISALTNEVYNKVYDIVGNSELIDSILTGLSDTGFEKDSLMPIFASNDCINDWEIGEAYAQAYLEDNISAVLPWNLRRDIKKPVQVYLEHQALNQFDADKGWVAYVAPTKALVSQITRRLRKDFDSKIKVEQLSSAVEIDAFEDDMLSDSDRSFDVLVATPEKLNLVIRNNKVPRPLSLIVMDEAHNIEDTERGLRIELLLATVKSDCPTANFLLLMPYVENALTLSKWLSSDISSGKSISIGSTPWLPNERIVGLYKKAVINDDIRGNWEIQFKTLTTTPKTINLGGEYSIYGTKHFGIPQSSANRTIITAAMAKTMSERGTSLAIGRTTDDSWNMARKISATLNVLDPIPNEVLLVQKYLKSEISPDFELIVCSPKV